MKKQEKQNRLENTQQAGQNGYFLLFMSFALYGLGFWLIISLITIFL